MSGPPRLSRDEDTFEAKLLRAGKAEQPRREGVKRTVLAASAVALASCGGAAVKTGAGAGKLGSWLFIVGGGLLVALGVGVAVRASTHDPAPSVPPVQPVLSATEVVPPALVPAATAPSATPVASAPPVAPSGAAAPRAVGSTQPRAAVSGAQRTPSSDDELTLLRRAKTQLAAHESAAALDTLDGYARTFPSGTLAEEAAALRVEALVASADPVEARRAAALFLERYPKSPYAQRVRSAVGNVPAAEAPQRD